MEFDFGQYDAEGFYPGRSSRGGRGRVLLREPERCVECGRVYLSLYPVKRCVEHDGLDKVS